MEIISFSTPMGTQYQGDSVSVIQDNLLSKYKGKVQLLLTSPPFPLNLKKKYGNLTGEAYKDWLVGLAPLFAELLTEDGSIVLELGNAWEPLRPVQSLLTLESLLGFVKHPDADLRLCQEFICYNPSRLPSPAQWVTINRIRTTDSYTHVWWMSKTDYPKADNSKVLRPYSKSMKRLLERQSFNQGPRPSQHKISKEGFLQDNNGSIAHNFFEMESLDKKKEVRLPNAFRLANTSSNDFFLRTCRERKVRPHPARMPEGLVNFFLKFLTDPGDLVLDPFGGSNTTGYCAEKMGRKWISIEAKEDFIEQAKIRFEDPDLQT